jgi:FecR protein
MKIRQVLAVLVATGALGTLAYAQSVISVRSGVIHLAEGDVFLADKLVEPKFGEFPEMKPAAVLRTEDGRAEVLLTPGVFLRMGEDSAFRMVKNQLEDTQVELVAGSLLIECAEMLENNAVTVKFKEYSFTPHKAGIFRLDAEPGRLRVYDGEVMVIAAGTETKVKRGKEMSLDGGVELAKFDPEMGDPLYRWAKRRAGYIAMANLSAAKSLSDSGRSWRSSGWYMNPYFGMMTYIPMGYINSPFGYGFYGPQQVYRVYEPRPVYMGGGNGGFGTSSMGSYNPGVGYNTVGRSVGSSASISGSPSGGGSNTAAAGGGGQSAARSADTSAGRGGGSGGGRGR